MDFSALSDALSSASFYKIADVCEEILLQVAADAIPFQNDWPYSIHLLGYIYIEDINSARYLWKSIPPEIKEANPEVVAAWKIGQRLWARDYQGVYQTIRGFNWTQQVQLIISAISERFTEKMFQLLLSAYSTISIHDAALFLGMNEGDATNYVLGRGWTVDPVTQMLTVKKPQAVKEQILDISKLQSLTEYVVHLEHHSIV
uniref:COP9 signalosome complex subunit 8 n=1 Tax=Kalanchoe fedtschenkoi TaxID=63787 RepID=A0A7N0UEL2_KALFE